jgi:hypothetical protein
MRRSAHPLVHPEPEFFLQNFPFDERVTRVESGCGQRLAVRPGENRVA